MSTAATATDSTWEMVKHAMIDIEVLEDLNPSDKTKIYTVPSNLRKMDEEAFTPQLISIGPIHFGKQHLKEMQKVKYSYFHAFWKRVSNEEEAKNQCKNFLECRIKDIRECYEHKFPVPEIKDEQFVEIVLLDSVFLVEHFLREREFGLDKYILTNYLREGILRDILLLENQLPFWVLRDLYQNIVIPTAKVLVPPDFVQLTSKYFASLYMYPDYFHRDCEGVDHFVEFFWRGFLPVKQTTVTDNEERFEEDTISQASARKLYEAGVSFHYGFNRSLIDITFEKEMPYNGNLLCLGCLPSSCCRRFKALLVFPCLRVDEATTTILKNLMAFEQNRGMKPFITSYVSLLCSLVHTKEDAELLVEKGCIFLEQGSDEEEAVNMLKVLSKHVAPFPPCHGKVIRDISLHYNSNWKKAMGTVRRVYFRDPWRSTSTIIAIVVLIFTFFGFYRDIRAFVLSN